MAKINIKNFKEAALDSGGIITTIANRIHVTRRGLYQWMDKHPESKEIVKSETEKILDMAETSLFEQVADRDLGATKFLLATKGKTRGYVEQKDIKTEHSGSIGVTEIKVVMTNESRVSPNSETDNSIQDTN